MESPIMSTPSTRRKARDIALQLLSDVNDKQQRRYFEVKLDLQDEVGFQIMNDLIDAMHDHGAPIESHSVRSELGQRSDGVQKVTNVISLICKINPDP